MSILVVKETSFFDDKQQHFALQGSSFERFQRQTLVFVLRLCDLTKLLHFHHHIAFGKMLIA